MSLTAIPFFADHPVRGEDEKRLNNWLASLVYFFVYLFVILFLFFDIFFYLNTSARDGFNDLKFSHFYT